MGVSGMGGGGGKGVPFLRRTRETLVRRIWFEGCEGRERRLVGGFGGGRGDGLADLLG